MAPPRIERPLTPTQTQTPTPAAAPAAKQPANQIATKPADGGDLGHDLGVLGHDLGVLGHDLVDKLETFEKKAVDTAEHLLPKARDLFIHLAKDLGFDVSDPTPVPGTDTPQIPAPKDGPVNPAYPTRPHGPLHGPIQHHEWYVTDGLARGDQPTAADVAYMKQQGFKSLIDLRGEDNSDEAMAKQNGMNYLHLDWKDGTAPTEDQMKQILDFSTKAENQPAFIHCLAGRNRTSVAVAAYQMAVEGKSLNQALTEGYDWGLHTPEQVTFLKQFAADLQAGKIAGYPLQPMATDPTPPPEPPNPPNPPKPPHVPIPPLGPEQERMFTMPEGGAWPFEDAINRATKSVDLSVYMLNSGFVTNSLKAAAARGVKVRVMLEPSPEGSKTPDEVNKQLADLKAAGIDAEVTPPNYDANHAVDHAKFMVIDGGDVMLGTGNLVASSLGGTQYGKDRDFWIEDDRAETASEAEQLFNADWNRQDTSGVDFKNLWVTPDNADARLGNLIDSSKNRLLVYQQEMFDQPLLDKIIAAKQRGVDVQVIMPSPKQGQQDNNADALAALQAAGVKVKEDTDLYIHAKAMVVDDQAFVGSQNFSNGGLHNNRELGEVVDDPAIVSQLADQFKKDMGA